MDIKCAKCHEPWDAYGVRHGDMTPEESRRFLKGEGCPGCNFGTKCPDCSGTGKESNWSPHSSCICGGNHYLIVRLLDAKGQMGYLPPGGCFPERTLVKLTPKEPVPDQFAVHFDFTPNVKTLTPEQRRQAVVMQQLEWHQCRDGWYLSAKLACPQPHAEAPACTVCGGDGKFHQRGEDKQPLFQIAGEMLGDDTDGLQSILEDHS